MLLELQFLGPEQKRESDLNIIRNHLETLFLLVTKGGEKGKEIVKEAGAYVIIRELHLEVEDEGAREVCERIVQVLMGDEGDCEGLPATSEAGTTSGVSMTGAGIAASAGKMVTQTEEPNDDDDDKIVEIF